MTGKYHLILGGNFKLNVERLLMTWENAPQPSGSFKS